MFKFVLTYSGIATEVIEPQGWTEFQSEIKRDFDSHGVVFKYTSGTIKLGFADGRDILETAFQNDGYDAEVTLTVSQRASTIDPWVQVYEGTAIMANRELTLDYFTVDFEESSFQQKVINRLDIPVNLNRANDLDGNALTGSITKQTDTFNTIRLYRAYYGYLFDENVPAGAFIQNNITSETNSTTLNKTKSVFGYGVKRKATLGSINITSSKIIGTADDYLTGDRPPEPIFIAEANGAVTFTGAISYKIGIGVNYDATSDIDLDYFFKLVQYRDGALQSTNTINSGTYSLLAQAPPSRSNTYTDGGNPITDTFNLSFTDAQVETGDQFYLIFEGESTASAGNSSGFMNLFLYDDDQAGGTKSYIDIQQLPENTTVSLNHYLIHDVMARLAYILTGSNTSFYSDFFGLTDHGYATDGCGGLNSITNGYQLRGVDEGLTLSMRDVLDWASARYGTGWGFEKYGAGYRFRVELMEHFYADAEILSLDPIQEEDSYREESATELEFNTVNIGYEKYFNEVALVGSFEDFLTESFYALPVATIKGDYRKKSPIIASNDLIQATYEQRQSADAWKYDEDNFVIAIVRSGSDFIQENQEYFTEVNGLDDPSTAYNIRHAPVYMFLEHALLVNSVLFGKDLTASIQNTTAKINTNFSARGSNYACLLADSQQLLRSATGDITIENNYAGLRLFKPVKHTLRVALTATQLTEIINNMEGFGSNNYGYLSYQDNEGTLQKGYPMLIQWNPNEEIATIETIEKADNYGL